MSYISNSPFTETEFIGWKREMEKSGLPLPSKEGLISTEEKIKKALDYRYSSEEVDGMVIRSRRERLVNDSARINVALEMSQVTGQLETYRKLYTRAKKRGEQKQLSHYKETLRMLKEEERMLAELQRKHYEETEVQDKVEEFNVKGKLKQQTIDSLAGRSDEKPDSISNPFTRRYVQPQTIWRTESGPFQVLDIDSELVPENMAMQTGTTGEKQHQKEAAAAAEEEEENRVKTFLNKHAEKRLEEEDTAPVEEAGEVAIFPLTYAAQAATTQGEVGDMMSFQEWRKETLAAAEAATGGEIGSS